MLWLIGSGGGLGALIGKSPSYSGIRGVAELKLGVEVSDLGLPMVGAVALKDIIPGVESFDVSDHPEFEETHPTSFLGGRNCLVRNRRLLEWPPFEILLVPSADNPSLVALLT